MIHYYYGYGKGKTTAAMGLALRALGQGREVVIVQFLKDGQSGEISALEGLPGVTVLYGKGGKGFTFQMTDEEKLATRRVHDENLARAVERVREDRCGMLVLDEVGDALELLLLDEAALAALLGACPERTELVMTGHAALPVLVNAADYVTRMEKIKHPYDCGVGARRGVEF